MRWGSHLIVAAIVGILGIGVWEIYSNQNMGQEIISVSKGMDIGSIIAILILVIILLWWKASRN